MSQQLLPDLGFSSDDNQNISSSDENISRGSMVDILKTDSFGSMNSEEARNSFENKQDDLDRVLSDPNALRDFIIQVQESDSSAKKLKQKMSRDLVNRLDDVVKNHVPEIDATIAVDENACEKQISTKKEKESESENELQLSSSSSSECASSDSSPWPSSVDDSNSSVSDNENVEYSQKREEKTTYAFVTCIGKRPDIFCLKKSPVPVLLESFATECFVARLCRIASFGEEKTSFKNKKPVARQLVDMVLSFVPNIEEIFYLVKTNSGKYWIVGERSLNFLDISQKDCPMPGMEVGVQMCDTVKELESRIRYLPVRKESVGGIVSIVWIQTWC